jgi:hypothetical protein
LHGKGTIANGKAQMQVTPQYGEGQMLELQDIQAIQAKLDARIHQCKGFQAIIEHQVRLLDELEEEKKILRERIIELENELEGQNCTFSVSCQHFPRLT